MSDAARLPSIVQTPEPDLETELGVGITMPFGMGFESTAELLNQESVTIPQLRDMRRRDAQVRALYRLITLPIRASLRNFVIIPVEGGDQEAEFIEAMLKLPPQAGGMTVTFERFISQTLLALGDGFSAFEIVYRMPETGDLAGKFCIKKMARRPPETCTFVLDRHGGFAAIRQRTSFQGRNVNVTFEPPYVWFYAAQEEENPYYGQSYFIPAWYHYDQKQKCYFITHVAAQFRAVPGRVGTYPAGSSGPQRDKFRKALADFGLAQAMMKGPEYLVEELGKTQSQFNFVELINHHNQMQSKSVLAEFLDRLDKEAMVDFSTSEDDMFVMALQSIMSEIEVNVNQHMLPNLIDWNFGTGKYPEFRFALISEQQKKAIGTAFNALAVAPAVQVTPEFIYQLEKQVAAEMGLEIDYDALDDELEEEQALEREAQKATAQATKAKSEFEAKNPAPPKPVAATGSELPLTLADLHAIALAAKEALDVGDTE